MTRTSCLSLTPLLALMLGCQQAQPAFQSGDLIFQDLDACALCEGIESVTKQQFDVTGPDLSHVAIVSVEETGVFVYEAWDEVRRVPLEDFLEKGDYEVGFQTIRRPKGMTEVVWAKVKTCLDEALGSPYDAAFLVDNQAYYCSELVVDAFNTGFAGDYFSYVPMYYGEPGTPEYRVWHEYFASRNQDMPSGQPGASPLGLFLSEKLRGLPD